MQNTIYTLVGPTSTGKTSLALELCKKYNGVIISADSRQVYRYMDIGTGKVPINSDVYIEKREKRWVFDGVDIWGYDLVEPDEYFSAFDYALFAREKISRLQNDSKHNIAMLVGGTGFYIDATTGRKKLDPIEPDFELREELEQMSLRKLREKLTSLNKSEYKTIDKNNKVRLVRAIEKNILKEKDSKNDRLPKIDARFKYIGLRSERPLLYQRVDKWIDSIWNDKLFDEVRWLMESGYENSDKLKGLVYRSAVNYLEGEKDSSDAAQRAKYDLHGYVRRQLTWFKKNKNIEWYDIKNPNTPKAIKNLIK